MQKTQIIAHRGASYESPENTISAIKKAISLKVDWIEIDVHLSKDHIPVVIHDDTIKRTTSATEEHRITDLTLSEIKKLDAGSWYHSSFKKETIPTLEEVLALDFKNCGLMIEIKKSPFPASLVTQKILEIINKKKAIKHLILGSFESEILQTIKENDPHIDLIHIIDKKKQINQLQGQRVALWEKLLSDQLIEELINKKQEIWTYTIDHPKRAHELKIPGITGVITNNPRLMKKIFHK